MAKSVRDYLREAKANIEVGDRCMRFAAEALASAIRLGCTQRKAAEAVGKSLGYVNRLLLWRQGGYRDTPFGPEAKAKRERAKVKAKAPISKAARVQPLERNRFTDIGEEIGEAQEMDEEMAEAEAAEVVYLSAAVELEDAFNKCWPKMTADERLDFTQKVLSKNKVRAA